MLLHKRNLSVLDWFIVFILLSIPVLNVILLIIWLLDSRVNKTFKNLLIAYVIIALIFGGGLWGLL